MAKEKKATKTAYQRFEVRTVNRETVIEAPFNPREIDESAKGRLRENLKRVGLAEPLIVNGRTMHLVSGHQRLAIMDAIEKRKDYLLDVAIVDLDEKTEKEQIVFLNNELAMGNWDLLKLERLVASVDYRGCGFESWELLDILPSWSRPPDAIEATPVPVSHDIMLVFRDRTETDKFMDLLKLPRTEKYISGDLVASLLTVQ